MAFVVTAKTSWMTLASRAASASYTRRIVATLSSGTHPDCQPVKSGTERQKSGGA
jgi:hypothetical protein